MNKGSQMKSKPFAELGTEIKGSCRINLVSTRLHVVGLQILLPLWQDEERSHMSPELALGSH